MRIPKGKGFDLAGGLIITVVLDDITLIGTFLGEIEGEKEQRHHDEPIICPPAKVEVNLQEDPEFILLQLVCDADIDDGPEIEQGTIVAVNTNKIQFIAPGGECGSHSNNDKKG